MSPLSDIDVDLSSEDESKMQLDDAAAEAEASRILQGEKLYGFGSKDYAPNTRRMDFSPTPPPESAEALATESVPHNGISATTTLSPLSAKLQADVGSTVVSSAHHASELPPAITQLGGIEGSANDDDVASENCFVKEGSAESISARHASSPAIAATPSASRSRTSIWVHFTRDADYATNRRGRCVYCRNYYSCSSGSTGNMWRHIKRSHPEKAAHAAPLATHGLQTTPQQQQQRSEASILSSDSRSRKRQASMSSPIQEHMMTPLQPTFSARAGVPQYQQMLPPPPPSQQIQSHYQQDQQLHQQLQTQQLRQQIQQQNQQQSFYTQQHGSERPSAARQYDDNVYGETNNATRAARLGDLAEGSALSPDSSGASTENLNQALKLLLTLVGRNTQGASNDRASHQAQSSLLLGLLENLNTASSGRIATGNGDADHQPTRHLRHSNAPFRSGGGTSLTSIAESGHQTAGDQLNAGSSSGGGYAYNPAHNAYYSAGGQGAAVNPESINQFVIAVGDAIRANTEASSAGGSSPTVTRAQKTIDAYVDFMVRDLVSVEKMLSPGMQQLMANLSHGSTPPSPSVLMGELQRQKDVKARDLRQKLDAVSGRISISIGTGKLAGTLYHLAVYAHWTDEGFVRHSELLDCHCVDGPATSSDIIFMFESTLTQYNLFARLGTVTTNYTREFVEFLNQVETICHARGVTFDLDRNQSTCIVSSLLDAKDKLLAMLYGSDAAVSANGSAPNTPIGKLRLAVQALSQPGAPGAQQLVELCRTRSITLNTLDFDYTRTWESTMTLLDSALSIYSELSIILSSATPAAAESSDTILPEEWLSLSQTHVLLRILDLAITTLARLPTEFPSIVDVVPVYDTLIDNLQGFLQTVSLDDLVRRTGESLRDYLAQCHPFQSSPIYRLAPLFDPRLKTAYYADRGLDEAWTSRTMREARSILSEYIVPISNSKSADSASDDNGASRIFAPTAAIATAVQLADDTGGQQSVIKSQIDAFIQLSKPSATNQLIADSKAHIFKRALASGRTELDEYISAPLASPSMSVLSWWRIHHLAFPGLSKLAREYLSISACSNNLTALLLAKSEGAAAVTGGSGRRDYSQLVGMDKKLVGVYICLNQWQTVKPPTV
ncbi:hypothetical protein LPJ66_001725 [Kickxella alabastrina]|uniref:Uncharacterized protein n=1 Tax=Kickxella alabastrina TaxID=61397 RepID=A0ACC1ISG2_9FUNG|nr:hypothetical protein LPJ66_001725 [Kickxella alabastrina]